MNKHDIKREFHDRLYKESLGSHRKVMPFYRVATEACRRFYSLVFHHAQEH